MQARVVVSFQSAAQEYQVHQAEDARAVAAKVGLPVQIQFAEGNGILQIQQLFKQIHLPMEERPAAIVVSTHTADGLERVARNAVKAGVCWVLLNRTAAYLDTIRSPPPAPYVGCVTTDHREVGRIQGQQIRKLLPAGGSILYLQGPAGAQSAELRLAGARQELDSGYQLNVMNSDWSEAGGERAVTAWLRLKTSELTVPNLVCSQNDLMASGARTALEARQPDWAKVPFIGVDGLPNGGQRLVKERRLAATVVIPSCAGLAMTLVAQALSNGSPPAQIVLPPVSHPALGEIRPR